MPTIRASAGHALFLRLRQKQALGKLLMHRDPQSGDGDRRCHTARSCDTLKKRDSTHSPRDIVKLPFYLHDGPRTKALSYCHRPGTPWRHRMRCGGSDRTSSPLRSLVEVFQEHPADSLTEPVPQDTPWGVCCSLGVADPGLSSEARRDQTQRAPSVGLTFTFRKGRSLFNTSYVTLSFSSFLSLSEALSVQNWGRPF